MPKPMLRITEKEWAAYSKQAGNQLFNIFAGLTAHECMSLGEMIKCLQAILDIFRRMEAAGVRAEDKSNWIAIHDDRRMAIAFYRREDYDFSADDGRMLAKYLYHEGRDPV